MSILALATGASKLFGGGKSEATNNNFGKTFQQRLNNYKQGVADEYTSDFYEKLQKLDKLNGTSTTYGSESSGGGSSASSIPTSVGGIPTKTIGIIIAVVAGVFLYMKSNKKRK
jgi:hypothetical protein